MLTLSETLAPSQALPAPPPPPGVPAIPGAVFQMPAQTTDVATLRLQLQELNVQQTGLQAQWDGLYSQLNNMLKTNPARPGVQQAWADVGVQIARVKGEIAYREARISQIQGVSTGTTNPAGPSQKNFNPNIAVPAGLLFLMVLGLPVSMAWARRILRGKPQQPSPSASPDHSQRLDRIEQSIDAVAIEVERIAEGQRFVTKIMAERPAERPAAASSVNPASAPKALGAGPVEPIVAPQRDRARQPIITPH